MWPVLWEIYGGYESGSNFDKWVIKEKEENMQGKLKWFPTNGVLVWSEWYSWETQHKQEKWGGQICCYVMSCMYHLFFFLSAIVNFILIFITWRRNPNDRLVFLAQEKCNTHMAYILACHTYFSLRSWIAFWYYVNAMQDMQPLKPAEMVEHLKQGLGKEGQVFTYITFWNLYCKQSNSILILQFVCADRTYPRDII